MLGSLWGAFGVSWGRMFGPQEPSGRSWGSMVGPQEPSGRSWGKRARDLRAQGGPWKPNSAPPARVLKLKTVVFSMYFDDFQKRHVFQRRAPGASEIRLKTVVFAPWGSLGASSEVCLRALWVPGALQESWSGFFWRQGGPLGAAKACIIANYDGKTNCFLMILIFALSDLGGVPGSVKI